MVSAAASSFARGDERGDEVGDRPAGKGRGLDAQRNQIQHDAVERARERLGRVGLDAETVRGRRAREHEH